MAEIYYEPSGANCSGTDYTRASITAAADKALELAKAGQTEGRDKYPHAYNDYEHFKFPHAVKPYLEFPILQNGEVYNGQQPGADRVVIGSIAADYSSAIYCGVITHTGSTEHNGFLMCRDDTMNVQGNGSDVPSDNGGDQTSGTESHSSKRHHKHHDYHHRKLIDRIDL